MTQQWQTIDALARSVVMHAARNGSMDTKENWLTSVTNSAHVMIGWRDFKHLSVLDLVEFLRKENLLDPDNARAWAEGWGGHIPV